MSQSRRKPTGWRFVKTSAWALSGWLVLAYAGEAAAGIACRRGDEAYHALKMTRFSGGIRVDYLVVATGERTWTNMTSELVHRFHVEPGKQFCMVKTKRSAKWVDFD